VKVWALHLAFLALLLALALLLPAWPQGVLARVMVLGLYAMGYNLLFGYTGLLSLGHALFFAGGMYVFGLSGLPLLPGLAGGALAGALLGAVTGALALRTKGVGFMIVTLMFAQAGWLTILYFGDLTRGDEGFTVPPGSRQILGWALAEATPRAVLAWGLFAVGLLVVLALVRSPFGRVLVAIRENEDRVRLLGFATDRYRLGAIILSGSLSGLAGAGYAALFGSVGATFATVQYSILPLVWVLIGGAGTVIGPFIGTLFLFLLIDWASDLTPAYMLVTGVVLVAVTLFAPQGIAGLARRRWPGLP
jgi:branched-chain amino acid transport system permease protein